MYEQKKTVDINGRNLTCHLKSSPPHIISQPKTKPGTSPRRFPQLIKRPPRMRRLRPRSCQPQSPSGGKNGPQSDFAGRQIYQTKRDVCMNCVDQDSHQEVGRALKHLRIRTTENLQAFNDAVPNASWLRRSEIERFTVDLLRSAELAPQRRRPIALGNIAKALSWITQVRLVSRSP